MITFDNFSTVGNSNTVYACLVQYSFRFPTVQNYQKYGFYQKFILKLNMVNFSYDVIKQLSK